MKERSNILSSKEAQLEPDESSTVNLDLVPVRVEGIRYKLLDQGVLVHASNISEPIRLVDEKALFWALCDGRQSLSEIAKRLGQLRGDLKNSVSMMSSLALFFIKNGLITVRPAHASPLPLDISNYSHVVSTRGGLYIIRRDGYKKVMEGMFFGLVTDVNKDILAFQFPHEKSSLWNISFREAKMSNTNEGVITRFLVKGNAIVSSETAYKKLANNTHDITLKDGYLYSLDCEGQEIRKHVSHDTYEVCAEVEPGKYHHINSFNLEGDYYRVMQCLNVDSSLGSGFVQYDSDWKKQSVTPLPAQRAHDIVSDKSNDDAFWYCDSKNGNVGHWPSLRTFKVRDLPHHGIATRGLAYDGECLIIGCGFLGDYKNGNQVRHKAVIVWWNRLTHAIEHELAIPEMPCVIRAIN